jgi:hypothetical protein
LAKGVRRLADRIRGRGAQVRRLPLKRAACRSDFERGFDRGIKTAPCCDIERQIAPLHFYP